MSDNTFSNKRIAKNTIFLYIRMLIMLVVSLYTSRVVLQVLGIDNYGIYNVVSGVIVMFSFVNSALTTGTQRHLSYELGKPDGNVAKIFTACLNTHYVLAGVILLLSETIGLWFLNTQMNFPEGRMTAVNIVYQMAVLSAIVNIVRTPFESTIVSYEKMDFYAYISIIEAFLKLGMVFILKFILVDKLISYSCLIAVIVICMFLVYRLYVYKNFKEIRVVKIQDKNVYRYIISFSSWTLFGAFSSLLESQGLNIIINITWGVALNAAVGVATQVRSALYQFVSGFQKALSPQLVISESNGNRERQSDLIYKSSRFSFFLMWVMTIPLCSNLSYILDLWLDKVPTYACEICYLLLAVSLLECLSYPLYTTIFATGKIKIYQLIVALIRMIAVMLALIISRFSVEPFLIYITPCLSELFILFYRIGYLKTIKGLSVVTYLKNVITPIFIVILFTALPVYLYKIIFNANFTIIVFLVETMAYILITLFVVYYFGMRRNERLLIKKYIVSLIEKKK